MVTPGRSVRGAINEDNIKDASVVGEDSNDSWDLDEMMKINPKMAAMMQGHKKSGTSLVYLYHDQSAMLDNQPGFDATFPNPMDFYKLVPSRNGGAIFERDVENELVKEMMEKILFEVFVHDFK